MDRLLSFVLALVSVCSMMGNAPFLCRCLCVPQVGRCRVCGMFQAFAYANKQGHREVELLKVHGSENVRGPYGSNIYKSEEKIPLSRIEVLGHFKENPKTGRWDRVD